MLKNRQEGIVNLHGLWAAALTVFLFLGWGKLFDLTGRHVSSENLHMYLVGTAIASVLNLRLYRSYSSQFSSLGWSQTFRLTYHQVFRITLVLLAIYFALQDVKASRMFLGSFLLATFLSLYVVNKVLPKRLCQLSFKTQIISTVIIGTPKSLKSLKDWTASTSDLGIDIVGYISEEEHPDSLENSPIPHLGSLKDLRSILDSKGIAQIVLIQNAVSKEATNEVLAASQKAGCRIRIYNNWQEQYNHRIVVEHEGKHTFLTLEDEPLENPINRITKRGFDIAVSLPIVAFVLPVLTLFVYLFQRKQSEGPIFYAQPRTGMTKRTFHIIKYRTMHVSDENAKNVAKQATKGDSRIYPFGAILRKTSLDELPQFINVLLGDMSVAGPRPHLINHDKEFSETLKTYYTRHFVKPGITGLAQSKGYRGEIQELETLKRRISYDIFYINNWSLLLDVKICIMTARDVLFPPKTAY
ncbi:sugar transferase [Puniceicoccaceae bacterium K14]|nr:sugar transferase [Puniceicoccaceae bacterium K14]